MRVKKNVENLIGVAKSICDVNFSSCLNFYTDFEVIENSVLLVSPGRDAIGGSIISCIPSNYRWRVTFVDGVLNLRIWF